MKGAWSKIWHFIWEDDSVWSWIVNIILAFVIIKFLVYPGLGFIFGTSFPIVAVVSQSMEHDGSFDEWWETQKDWYMDMNITKENFLDFSLRNGFDCGDLIILFGKEHTKIKVGEVIVFFDTFSGKPIIHRVVKIDGDGTYLFQTKGDHNPVSGNIDMNI